MLTIQEIKNAKPTDKQRKLSDRDGLYLVVYRNSDDRNRSYFSRLWAPTRL